MSNKLLKTVFRLTVIVVVFWYLLIPSVRLLFLSDDIKHVHISETRSYNANKAIVNDVTTILNEKYPINYDKDVFKRIYQYDLHNLNLNINDTLLETVKKNTYFFEQLKPKYNVGDTIVYFKSNLAKSLTQDDYNFMIDNNEGGTIKWFSVMLLIISLILVVLLTKPLLKQIK